MVPESGHKKQTQADAPENNPAAAPSNCFRLRTRSRVSSKYGESSQAIPPAAAGTAPMPKGCSFPTEKAKKKNESQHELRRD